MFLCAPLPPFCQVGGHVPYAALASTAVSVPRVRAKMQRVKGPGSAWSSGAGAGLLRGEASLWGGAVQRLGQHGGCRSCCVELLSVRLCVGTPASRALPQLPQQ